MSTHRILRAAMILFLASLVSSCDESRVRQGASEFATFEEAALRVLVSPTGIGRLVEVANPEGFPLDAEPYVVVDDDDIRITVGPLSQALPVATRMSVPSLDAVSLTTRLDDGTILIPMRIRTNTQTHICRWRFDASRVEVLALVELIDSEEGETFSVLETPVVELDGASVTTVSECALADLLPEDIDDVLIDYVAESIASSATQALPASPVQTLGLVQGNIQLTHLSPFENRSGLLVVESSTPGRPEALAIDQNGLSVVLDATADAQRARCAPPISIDPTTNNGAGPLSPDVLRRFGADFALAISRAWLVRVAQAATLSGYACRGLEDPRDRTSGSDVLPTDEALLEELGLGSVPVGPTTSLVLSPGTLPRFELRPANGTVFVTWDDLQLEIYSDVLGARTRLASIVTDAGFGLRPRSGAVGAARFDIESIEVTTERLDSEFLADSPADENVDRWTQRALLLMLDEQFEVPLPLDPTAPVRVVGVQVRDDDIATYLRFED